MANHWWLLVLVALHASCGLSEKPSRSKTLSSLLRMLKNLGVGEPGSSNSTEAVPGKAQEYGPPAWSRPSQQYGAPLPFYRPAPSFLPISYGPPPAIPTQKYGAPLPRIEYGAPTSSRNPFLPIRYGPPPAVPYQQSRVPISYGPPKPSESRTRYGRPPVAPRQEYGAPLPAQNMLPVSYGPPPAVLPSTGRNSLPESYGPPGPYKSITVKQHLLNALHHIVDAINVAPEDLLRQITSWRPEIASKIEKIEALLRSLPAGRLKLLRDNPDVAAIMQQLGVRLPEQSESDVEITIPDKPDRVDEGPKQDLEVIVKPDGVEIVKPDEQNPSELEVTVKPNGVEIVIPEKPDHVDEGKKVESSEHHSVEIVVTDKPEEAEIVVTPHSVVIEIPNKPDHVDEGLVKTEVSSEKLKAESPAASAAYEYDIPKGIEQLPLATVPDNQYEVPEVPAPINSKEPAVLEVTTELSETVEFEVTPSNLPTAQDVPVLPSDARPFLSNSFRKKLLQAVTKALRSYQQKLGLTTRLPPTQPPPKGKDEKLQELVQDTRSKIASMLKIIDKAAEDGKIPENLADEIDLNTPGILVQLSELEQLLGKDPNEPEKALPTKPDGTTDWGKILHGRDPPTGTRAPKKGKPEVVKASDDADEE
ncbi:uncharacterized protein LOC120420265 [Culex pipiens pallens]|uniref:uncharacterized protein LOC120420265 n=1 Tax=Culex pipiens pallens TaxID=42434 RepID=UPI0022AB2B76|nr:uncharacterized protein LOC120420265 [Culex pipiens pallens]